MKKFLKELRRREVFRTAGLYVGISWILIEVGSVVLPAFGAPDWLFRGAIIVAIVGFPVMLVLAWFFDVSEGGISLEGEQPSKSTKQLGARKSDFAIIGVLVVALIVSLYLNVSDDSSVALEQEPVSVLIADFQNTADEPLFDGVLEEALTVGIEVASHVTAIDRRSLLQIGYETTPGTDALDRESARVLAEGSGIQLLLAGSMQTDGTGYRIALDGIDVPTMEVLFTVSEKASSRDAVLQAIAELSDTVRKELGDRTTRDRRDKAAPHVLATSLAAAHAWVSGRQAESAGRLEDAAELYAQAAAADPTSGRALSSLALVEFALGRTEEAETRWARSLSLADTMTERERLHARGRHATAVGMGGETIVDIYAQLVDSYPADVDARDRYASALSEQLEFATAAEQIQEILTIFPTDHRYRTRLAQFAMYDSDWDTAADEAGKVIAADPDYGAAYLPLAMTALSRGDVDAARDAYRGMASNSKNGYSASVAELGLADMDLYYGRLDAAQARLIASIKTDTSYSELAAVKTIALAESYADQQDFPTATQAASAALQFDDGDAVKVPAALIYLRAGDLTSTRRIADELTVQKDAHSRAFGQMLSGLILEREGARTDAILAMRDALETAELWLIRFEIGKAYLRAGNGLEALDELMALKLRRGEATSAFLDGMPTYRLIAELPYWIGRVQEQQKNISAARASYAEFLALRPEGGALADDASQRMVGNE